MLDQIKAQSDLHCLIEALPPPIQQALLQFPNELNDLLEVVLDLGRLAEARYVDHERFLGPAEITSEDLALVVSKIGEFGEDNRAGIARTLHRISALRNRRGVVVGLTCRFGRAVFGTVTIIRDLIERGQSILLLGKPGMGKTTLLRETARVLADELLKRVVVVDTSNEIAGDGDIPHLGIGRARRMQVPRPAEQHAVMIEAVENHMPEVIVIDEIGTELEALAARTIAERGVQLVGTAHGSTLGNLMINPTLSDLIGGIQAVTLGDDEARRRGTQKTVLERKAPPTFDVLVEIKSWDQVVVYPDVAAAVDTILRGEELEIEQRTRTPDGKVTIANLALEAEADTPFVQRRDKRNGNREKSLSPKENRQVSSKAQIVLGNIQRIFPFGVSRNRLEKAIEHLGISAVIVRDMQEATLMMTLKSYYRQNSQRLRQAENQGIPVFVLRNNTIIQMERQLASIFRLENSEPDDSYAENDFEQWDNSSSEKSALLEAKSAIEQVMNGEQETIELTPRNSYIRRLQHELAGRFNLRSASRGNEPRRRVRISR